jgi:hypothetical protein
MTEIHSPVQEMSKTPQNREILIDLSNLNQNLSKSFHKPEEKLSMSMSTPNLS